MRRRSSWIAAAAAVAVMLPHARANRHGASPGLNGSPASGGLSCMLCHGEQVGDGTLQILGAPLSYRPDAVYDLIIRVADADQSGTGFQISAEDSQGNHLGALVITDEINTQFEGDPGWVTHTSAGVEDSIDSWLMDDAAEFQLSWRAPASDAGPVTFYAVANAINDNHNTNGDNVYLTDHTARFCPADTNNDGAVNVDDLLNVIIDWSTDGSGHDADIDGSGLVDTDDLVAVILAWGACG
ncbi:MAG: choice-of-anchor V domain-containing protein [Planctomycetota bacterium]|jgi:hypothetical protein